MVKKASNVRVAKKRNGRYLVKKRGGGLLNGEAKVQALVEAGVLKPQVKKAAPATEG